MAINTTTLFAYLRRSLFGNRMTQQQVDGVTAIIEAWKLTGHQDLRWLAYILATAFYETGGRMAPVREGFAASDAKARKIVAKCRYGVEDRGTGQVYYGRGFVQLTWFANYNNLGKFLGKDLIHQPDLALEMSTAARIIVTGMCKGMFTGQPLSDYFTNIIEDPVGARAVVNGDDKAELIASYYKSCKKALFAAETSTPQPMDVKPCDAQPDKPSLFSDKATIGAVGSAFAGATGGIVAGINNPWAFGAVVLVLICIILFFIGRYEIAKKGGA